MKTKSFLTLLLALVVQITFAQEKTVTGTVSDESGPLPGVNVIIKGTQKGTQTDFDGKYTLKAKKGDILHFSYIGMTPVEKTVGASNTIDAVMKQDANVLDEVVVVGYGTTTKKSYTGSLKTVKAETLENKSVSNVSQALAGEAAGVNVINTSGQPGTTATVRIRGFGSVNGNRSPLYVVDGIPFSGDISSINPADIETTTILKDATATAIYGARGANGVILINTKQGKNGKQSITVDFKTGVNFRGLPRYSTITSPEEYISLSWNALKNNAELEGNANPATYANDNLFSGKGINAKYNLWNVSSVSELIDPSTGEVRKGVTRKYTPENWEDYGFQQSIRTEGNVRFDGGNDKTRYFSSFGYLDDVGIILNSSYKRYSSRLNLEHKPKDWLTANVNIGYSYGETKSNGQTEDSGSIFWFTDNIPTIYPLFLRDDNGNKIADDIYPGNYVFDYGIGRGFGALTNSIADATYDLLRTKRHSLNGNISFKIDLTEDLTFTTRYGAQYYSLISDDISNPFYGSAAGESTRGRLYKQNRNMLVQSFLQMLTYKKTFGGDHNFEALAAHESFEWKRERSYIDMKRVVNLVNGLDQPSNYVETASASTGYIENYNIESYLGQVNYNFAEKYFLTGSLRTDGTSRFYKNKWGTFGSVGFGWVITKEDFFADNKIFDFLKLKASYGLVGDQAIGTSYQDYYAGQNGYSVGNLGGAISLTVRASQNQDITWETSKIFQTGLEFEMFDGIIEANVDYYKKVTDDLIFDRRIGPSVGDALITVNDGNLTNSGFEFEINAHLINKENFKLDFSVNGEMLSNELTKMPIDPATEKEKVIDVAGRFGRSKGHSIFDYYIREWTGVDSEDGAPTWSVYYDDANANGSFDSGEEVGSLVEYQAENPGKTLSKGTTKTYSEATLQYIGKSSIPDIRGAFRLSAEIYNFTISSQFAYSLGGYGYDFTYAQLMHNDQAGQNNWHTDIRNSWKKSGDTSDIPRLYSNKYTTVSNTSSRFITSSDFLALNNLKVGYSIPSKFIKKSGVENVNIWISGDNLFLLSARDGYNPITSESGASGWYTYTPLTTISAGVRIKF